MKSTGVVRKVDELGRIVIPKELRNTFDIKEKDPLEIFVEEEKIILKKYSPFKACMITGEVSDNNLSLADGKIVLSREGAETLFNELQQLFINR
jgi:AbrB family transcriptional regulator, transcriptional pleiotropic regulator of transition state genes